MSAKFWVYSSLLNFVEDRNVKHINLKPKLKIKFTNFNFVMTFNKTLPLQSKSFLFYGCKLLTTKFKYHSMVENQP